MFNEKSCNNGSQQRNKTIRAIVRRRLKGAPLKVGTRNPAQTSPNCRTDEDSGFSGDSFGAELSMDIPMRHSISSQGSLSTSSNMPTNSNSCSGISGACSSSSSGISSSSFSSTSCISGSSFGSSSCMSNNYSEIMLPTFGVSEELLVDPTINLYPKRIRLDMTEEANELPEGEASPPECQEGGSKIVSFKNVPGFVFPANTVQVKPTTTLVSISPRQTVQPSKQMVEHLLKQKLVAANKTTSKMDKLSKKKGRAHLLESSLPSVSSDGSFSLQLLTQPEGQHRARYLTEGSRGAVKDRAGTGHPSVKLEGYDKETVLQVFVASDAVHGGLVTPHLFYQACKVSGKNSTPCKEERVNGTTVLEITLQPDKDMTVSCDCVGILKERNVDVEQKMKTFVTRGKKKSTKCRLVFRAKVTLSSGAQEIIQVVSQPISCTQPPGVPEICRKSRSNCCVDGNEEMFIIGKNFYKDAEVIFRELNDKEEIVWSSKVIPEKDYLQANHLICQIPPYQNLSLSGEVEVQVIVVSCNKVSDPQPFVYLPQKKEAKEQTGIQLHPLPKGVSPSAVKLNELYTESGGGHQFSSKEIFHLAESSVNMNSVHRNVANGICANKDRAIIPPVQVNRVLAAVKPQMANSIPKLTLKNIHSNTFTTATVMTPKPSLNVDVVEVKEEGGGSMLENLVQMLKLLKSIPGNLHNPILELVAKELLRQVKKVGGDDSDVVGNSGTVQSHLLLSETAPYFFDTKEPMQKSSNSKNMNYVTTTGISTGSSSPKVYPVNSYQGQCPQNLPLQDQADTTLVSHAFVSPQQNKLSLQEQSTKVVYPIGGNFFPSRQVSKDDGFPNVVFSTQQGCGGSIQTVCQSSSSLVLNSLSHQQTIPQKINYFSPMNSLPHHQSCPTAQEPVLEQKLTHHEEPISNLLMHTTHPLNQGEVKTEGNLMRRGSSHSIHERSFILENQRTPIVSEAAFKIENCDPLLSQAANPVTSMALHTAVSLPGAHQPPSDGASMISQTINRGGVNEVPISNFSESELLDYINPTCFDNV